jgi:hypothetical protein
VLTEMVHMPITTYIADPANGFSPAERAALTQWSGEFDIDDAWKLIRRNVDRDCDRQDIDHSRLREYLRDIAQAYQPTVADAALAVMDSVFSARRSHFLLPGLALSFAVTRVARVARADHVLKYQLHHAGIAITMGLGAFIAALQANRIGGQDLAGSHMGRADHPVWVCPADQRPASADDCRNWLGLHHIDHGHLVSIAYPTSILAGHLALRAPTALDGTAGGAGNWIFAKRGAAGGPAWGHAVDLATSGAGVDEAVHPDFAIDSAKAGRMDLDYVGQIQHSPPQVSFARLLVSV